MVRRRSYRRIKAVGRKIWDSIGYRGCCYWPRHPSSQLVSTEQRSDMPFGENQIHLIGEPKSGSKQRLPMIYHISVYHPKKLTPLALSARSFTATWLTIIAFELARNLCTAQRHCGVEGGFDQRVENSFHMRLRGGAPKLLSFVVSGKHGIPLSGSSFPRTARHCGHGSSFAHGPVCSHGHFPDVPDLEALTTCAMGCLNALRMPLNASVGQMIHNTTYLLILRDPRDEVISSCFHKKYKGMTNESSGIANLELCVKSDFLQYATYVIESAACKTHPP